MTSRIRDLKQALSEQNEMITTLRRNNTELRASISGLHKAIVSYRPNFLEGATSVETGQFPVMTTDDFIKNPLPEIIRSIGSAFQVVVSSLTENREELTELYRELDADINGAMAQWDQLKAAGEKDRRDEAFRAGAVRAAAAERPKTPDMPMASSSAGDRNFSLPPTPPNTTSPEVEQQKKTSKQKGGAVPLEKLMSSNGARKNTSGASPTNDKSKK